MGHKNTSNRKFLILAIGVGAAGVAIGAYSIYSYAANLPIQP